MTRGIPIPSMMDSLQRVLLLVVTLLLALPMASNTHTTTTASSSTPYHANKKQSHHRSSLRPLTEALETETPRTNAFSSTKEDDECETMTLLLNTTHIDRDFVLVPSAHLQQTAEGGHSPIGPGTQQVGILPFVHSNRKDDDKDGPHGYYEVSITFVSSGGGSNTAPLGCVGVGAYTFLEANKNKNSDDPPAVVVGQITFTASCQGLPHLSITGGYGAYQGAYGHVHYNLPGPVPNTKRHELVVCRRPQPSMAGLSTASSF